MCVQPRTEQRGISAAPEVRPRPGRDWCSYEGVGLESVSLACEAVGCDADEERDHDLVHDPRVRVIQSRAFGRNARARRRASEESGRVAAPVFARSEKDGAENLRPPATITNVIGRTVRVFIVEPWSSSRHRPVKGSAIGRFHHVQHLNARLSTFYVVADCLPSHRSGASLHPTVVLPQSATGVLRRKPAVGCV
jgi:hypothetical protein